MRKILSVIGTRPEAIKMAPVISALNGTSGVENLVCVTGQHRTMLDQVLQLFRIVPDHDLAIMKPGQTLADITTAVLTGLTRLFEDQARPRAGPWRHHHRDGGHHGRLLRPHPVAHVEAGLRTGDLQQPWPEEMNRKVIDSMADVLFAPTESSRANLLREGLENRRILVTGNTVIDALLHTVNRLRTDGALTAEMDARFDFLAENKRMILVTAPAAKASAAASSASATLSPNWATGEASSSTPST